MEQLLNYRFTEGSLAGQSFGNLFLAAMDGISGSFDEAVHRMGEVLAITGRVLPVTNQSVHLEAEVCQRQPRVGREQDFLCQKAQRLPDPPGAPGAGASQAPAREHRGHRPGRPHFARPRKPLYQHHSQSPGGWGGGGHCQKPRAEDSGDEHHDPGRRIPTAIPAQTMSGRCSTTVRLAL